MSKDLLQLVERYKSNRLAYRNAKYGESEVRSDFIDKFFSILGWDMNNEKGLPQPYREVIRETRVKINNRTKKPDYEFRVGSQRMYFVEAKVPSVDISSASQVEPAFQIRSYGWSANLPISVLTNFENLIIYDTTIAPNLAESSLHSRLYTFHYSEYTSRFEEIYSILSHENAVSGNLLHKLSELIANRDKETIDKFFLKTLNRWRITLAKDILKQGNIQESLLNIAVQSFLLRILFLRMCEDRGIETYERLRAVATTNDWYGFLNLLQLSNQKYNSELFHIDNDPFSNPKIGLRLDSSTVSDIIEQLYYPFAPYTFSVLQPEFLGQIYEEFLQWQVHYSSNEVQLIKKPENENREIVPTPPILIDRVVELTLGSICQEKKVEDLFDLRVLDPACGSGGFLIAAYNYLMNSIVETYKKLGDFGNLVETPNGYRLTFEKKRLLLKKCIWGVDRDFLAVQVAQFSMLVKLLEDESEQIIIEDQLPILPSLERNIVVGDALIDELAYQVLNTEKMIGIPLNWNTDIAAFPFDVIVGNPPYLFTEAIKNIEKEEYKYYKKKYASAYKQFDKYYLFIERAMRHLLKPTGVLGMVTSSKFTTVESGKKLRKIIYEGNHLVKLINFGTAQLFNQRTNYICLLFLSVSEKQENKETIVYESVIDAEKWMNFPNIDSSSNKWELPRKYINTEKAWILPSTSVEAQLFDQMQINTTPLGHLFEVFNGIQTSANDIYVITQWKELNTHFIEFLDKDGQVWQIERAILRPFYEGSRDELQRLRSFYPMPDTARVIFPYEVVYTNTRPRAVIISPERMKAEYPNAYAYLNKYRERLIKRSLGIYPSDEWYRYGRIQALTAFDNRPKIVVGVNSLGDKYVLDENNTVLASGGTAGEVAIAHYQLQNRRSSYSLFFILALLNHKSIEYFCRKRGSGFNNSYFSRGTAILKDIPVPVIDLNNPNEISYRLYFTIIELCKKINSRYNDMETSVLSQQQIIRYNREIQALRTEMDARISELYNVGSIIDRIELPL